LALTAREARVGHRDRGEVLEMIHPMDPYPKLIINAALTGLVPTKAHTSFIPLSEDEIVKDAAACGWGWRTTSISTLRRRSSRPTSSWSSE